MDCKKIVITSGKGGVGKTTVTANLGSALASLGANVVLIDIDFGLNNLDVVMGMENNVIFDMLDVFEGRCRVKQALLQDKNKKNLYILPSGSIDPNNSLNSQNIKVIIDNISKCFDYILLDCPAGIDNGFHRAVSCSDEAIIVATPNITSLRDAGKTISILNTYKLNNISLVINRARGDLMLDEKMMYPSDIEDILKARLIGVLPEEDEVFLSSGYGLNKHSESFKAYKILAQNILENKRKIYDVTKKYSGFLGSIKRSIKKNI